MFNVTTLVDSTKQPHGGYVPITLFNVEEYNDGEILFEKESISPNIMGILVDYMTRFLSGNNSLDAFKFPLKGAELFGEKEKANTLLSKIKGLDEQSIIAACELIKYDVYFRTQNASLVREYKQELNSETIENVKIMVRRGLNLWEEKGKVVLTGFTFPKAKSYIISSADGDYLTEDTIWDFKVSKYEPTIQNTLQVLIYYLLGISSKVKEFGLVEKIAIFNPRLNKSYELTIDNINSSVIADVYSNIMLMDVFENCANDHIKDLKDEKLRIISADKVKKSKDKLNYSTYLYAVWEKGSLIEKVPQEYIDNNLCRYAFLEMRFGELWHTGWGNSNESYGLVNDLEKYLKYVPQTVWTYEFVFDLITMYDNSITLDCIPEEYRTDKVVARIVKIDDISKLESKYVTPGYYKECAKIYPEKFDLIPKEYLSKEDYELSFASVNKKSVLQLIPIEYQDYEFFYKSVSINPKSLRIVPLKFIDYEMCLKSVSINPESINSVPKQFLNYDLCELVISNKPSLIKRISSDLPFYSDLCELAVKCDWKTIKYIPKEQITESIIANAVAQSETAKKYI